MYLILCTRPAHPLPVAAGETRHYNCCSSADTRIIPGLSVNILNSAGYEQWLALSRRIQKHSDVQIIFGFFREAPCGNVNLLPISNVSCVVPLRRGHIRASCLKTNGQKHRCIRDPSLKQSDSPVFFLFFFGNSPTFFPASPVLLFLFPAFFLRKKTQKQRDNHIMTHTVRGATVAKMVQKGKTCKNIHYTISLFPALFSQLSTWFTLFYYKYNHINFRAAFLQACGIMSDNPYPSSA